MSMEIESARLTTMVIYKWKIINIKSYTISVHTMKIVIAMSCECQSYVDNQFYLKKISNSHSDVISISLSFNAYAVVILVLKIRKK